MDNPAIEAQARVDAAEDLRRKQAILKERYCPLCATEVGADYELIEEECDGCEETCCQHMGDWVETTAFEIFLCYECQETEDGR